MAEIVTECPVRRSDLIIQATGSQARKHVVKDPSCGRYFHFGEREVFLLDQLDGRTTATSICSRFSQQFNQPLATEDLNRFVELCRSKNLLQSPPRSKHGTNGEGTHSNPAVQRGRQSILYWRKAIYNPDALLSFLLPPLAFLWSRFFVLASTCGIVCAAAVLAMNWQLFATHFAFAMRWETVAIVWLTLLTTTICHELAHGLTCKRYGGEVKEIGFLLLLFTPCLYCNVSDAWLFRDRARRVLVTLAGTYCDLCIWAGAVLVWRVSHGQTFANYLAWVVISVLSVRLLFNLNPLLKLDGYYLLSDLLDIPNLRQRAISYSMQSVRCVLWGASPPPPHPKAKFLLGYGLACWLFSLLFLVVVAAGISRFITPAFGVIGVPLVTGSVLWWSRGLIHELFGGEVRKMFQERLRRTVAWMGGGTLFVAAMMVVPWDDQASGTFVLESTRQAAIHAPVAGCLKDAYCSEGDKVNTSSVILRMTIPDLASQIEQKTAELEEANAKLALLRDGPTEDELDYQRRRVACARSTRDIARATLDSQEKALEAELSKFAGRLSELAAECEHTKDTLDRLQRLRSKDAVAPSAILAADKEYRVRCARYDQVMSERQAKIALGTQAAKGQLASRELELTAEEGALASLEAGTRSEQIHAAAAVVKRLNQALNQLRERRDRLEILSPISGVVVTPHMESLVGRYFAEGDLICEVESPHDLAVVIRLMEDQAASVRPGQSVKLKARAFPFETFDATVDRIAPKAIEGDLQSALLVYCRLNSSSQVLRSGMSGHARVHCHRASLGQVCSVRCLRWIRTEFWW